MYVQAGIVDNRSLAVTVVRRETKRIPDRLIKLAVRVAGLTTVLSLAIRVLGAQSWLALPTWG